MIYIDLIKSIAEKYYIDHSIVYAICRKESSFEPLAVRYEPNYKWLFRPADVKPRTCSLNTEIVLQKTSWGLMQCMGALFRERINYQGWLNSVDSDVELQLEMGCKHLADKIRRYGLYEGILAYNSGSPIKNRNGQYINISYLNSVLTFQKEYLS